MIVATPEILAPTLTPFVYHAEFIDEYDGDTVDLKVDLGLDTYRVITVRLARINAPEKKGPTRAAGLVSKDAVDSWAKQHPKVLIRTYKDKTEKYGRYLADIFDQGECLNDLLVQGGFAVYKQY